MINYIINKFSSLGIFSAIIFYVAIFSLVIIITSFFMRNKKFRITTPIIALFPLVAGGISYFYGMDNFQNSIKNGDISENDIKMLTKAAEEISFSAVQFSLVFSIPLLILSIIGIFVYFNNSRKD